jgi:hypothetical protein
MDRALSVENATNVCRGEGDLDGADSVAEEDDSAAALEKGAFG